MPRKIFLDWLCIIALSIYFVLYAYGAGNWWSGGWGKEWLGVLGIIAVLALPITLRLRRITSVQWLIILSFIVYYALCTYIYFTNGPDEDTRNAWDLQRRFLIFIPFLLLITALSPSRIIFFSFVISAAVLSLFGFTETPMGSVLLDDFQGNMRSGYLNPIHYGNFAMLFFAALISFYIFDTRKSKTKIILWLLSITTLAGAIDSGSRGAVLSLPLILILLALASANKGGLSAALKTSLQLSAIVIISLLLSTNGSSKIFQQSKNQLVELYESDDMRGKHIHRPEMWFAAISIWQQSPLNGIGFTRYPDASGDFLEDSQSTYIKHYGKPHHAHSGYFDYLAAGGLVGLTAILLILGFPILCFLYAARKTIDQEVSTFYLAGATVAIVFATGNLTESLILSKGWVSLFVVTMALFVSALGKIEDTCAKTQEP